MEPHLGGKKRRDESSAVSAVAKNVRNPIYLTVQSENFDEWFCLSGNFTTGVPRRCHRNVEYETIPVPRFGTLPHKKWFTSLSMDGSIYLIGAKSCWRVTPSPEEKEALPCRQLPPMLYQDRIWPLGIFGFAGKIYVFGGCDSVPDPYAEVYHPESDQWVALPDTPQKFRRKVIFHAVIPHPKDHNKKIVLADLHGLDGLYAFDPDDKDQPWSCFHHKFWNGQFDGPVAVWKQFLIFLRGNRLFAYDFIKFKLQEDVWVPCGNYPRPKAVGFSCLVDLGNGIIFHLRYLSLTSGHWLLECSKLYFKIKNGEVMVELGKPVPYSATGGHRLPRIHCSPKGPP